MLGLMLALTLLGAPPAAKLPPPPPGAEMAKLFFLAGDLSSAIERCSAALKTEGARCGPMIKALARYERLVARRDALTPAEARAFIELDRQISPGAPGKLTEGVLVRFVTGPLRRAKTWADEGERKGALELVEGVLAVDPENPEARVLHQQLARSLDGGAAR